MSFQRVKKLLGERIASLRRERGLPQDVCAWRADLSKAYLSQIEAGKRLPTLGKLINLAAELKVEPRDLFVFPDGPIDGPLYDAVCRGNRSRDLEKDGGKASDKTGVC